jgi:hypothetical protein
MGTSTCGEDSPLPEIAFSPDTQPDLDPACEWLSVVILLNVRYCTFADSYSFKEQMEIQYREGGEGGRW